MREVDKLSETQHIHIPTLTQTHIQDHTHTQEHTGYTRQCCLIGASLRNYLSCLLASTFYLKMMARLLLNVETLLTGVLQTDAKKLVRP